VAIKAEFTDKWFIVFGASANAVDLGLTGWMRRITARWNVVDQCFGTPWAVMIFSRPSRVEEKGEILAAVLPLTDMTWTPTKTTDNIPKYALPMK
jgi:hypothetical protein